MRVVIAMEPAANGLIAGPDDSTDFVSGRSWRRFLTLMRRSGNNVMGRRTFEVALAEGRFPYRGVLNVVMTSRKIKNRWGNNVMFTDKPPRAVLAMMAKMGFETVLVGGASLNASFLGAGLVDELVLDVEPVVLGNGINMVRGRDFEARLRLIGARKFPGSVVELRYKVLKGR